MEEEDGSRVGRLFESQSKPPSREWLEDRVAALSAADAGSDSPLPKSWGGFRLLPERLKFWQQREDRLHDRLLYTRAAGGEWSLERLAP